MQQNIVVLKFGSSVLRSAADLPAAVHEIYRWYRDGARILAVVSAIGDTTEQLLAQARELSPIPDPSAAAQLLATGERTSAALLGVALDRAGVPARVVDPREIGLMVSGSPLDSEPGAEYLEGPEPAGAERRRFQVHRSLAVPAGLVGTAEHERDRALTRRAEHVLGQRVVDHG